MPLFVVIILIVLLGAYCVLIINKIANSVPGTYFEVDGFTLFDDHNWKGEIDWIDEVFYLIAGSLSVFAIIRGKNKLLIWSLYAIAFVGFISLSAIKWTTWWHGIYRGTIFHSIAFYYTSSIILLIGICESLSKGKYRVLRVIMFCIGLSLFLIPVININRYLISTHVLQIRIRYDVKITKIAQVITPLTKVLLIMAIYIASVISIKKTLKRKAVAKQRENAADKLLELKQSLDAGQITQTQFDEQKKQILSM